MPERPLDRPIYPVVVPANQGRPRTPRGGSRLRPAGAATQTGFPEERETASEWDRGTHTCCFRRPSSSRSPERASASTAASRITTSPPVRKKNRLPAKRTARRPARPYGSAVWCVRCIVICKRQGTGSYPETSHCLQPKQQGPAQIWEQDTGHRLQCLGKNTGSNPEPSHGPKQ